MYCYMDKAMILILSKYTIKKAQFIEPFLLYENLLIFTFSICHIITLRVILLVIL